MNLEMMEKPDTTDIQRRALLQFAAGIAVAAPMAQGTAQAAGRQPIANGKAGDFAFLTGEWRIKNRRLKDGKWDEFDGEATVVGMLDGIASVEELRIPARQFSGMGLRLLDVERKVWADHWVNGKAGVVGATPAWGSFAFGVGIWESEELENGKPMLVRGVWDQITAISCRWYQAVSRDEGITWEENWVMQWTRA